MTTSAAENEVSRPFIVGEVLIIGALLFVYDHIKRIAHRRPIAAEHNGRALLRVERAFGLDVEHGLNHVLTAHHAWSIVASYSYETLWWTTALIVLVVAYWKAADRYRLLRNVLVMINIVALIVFFVWPVMPPRLIPGAGFVDSVAAAGFGTKHVGRLPADQYAAMPSLHVAWAVYSAWAATVISRRRVVRVLAVLLPLVTVIDVMATGNHYLLDCVAGAALTAVVVVAMTRSRPGVAGVVDKLRISASCGTIRAWSTPMSSFATPRPYVELDGAPLRTSSPNDSDSTEPMLLPAGGDCTTPAPRLVLNQHNDIRMANPFSAVPRHIECELAAERGSPTPRGMRSGSAPRSMRTARSSRRVRTAVMRSHYDVVDTLPDDETLLFHCLVPASRWWDDIVFT